MLGDGFVHLLDGQRCGMRRLEQTTDAPSIGLEAKLSRGREAGRDDIRERLIVGEQRVGVDAEQIDPVAGAEFAFAPSFLCRATPP